MDPIRLKFGQLSKLGGIATCTNLSNYRPPLQREIDSFAKDPIKRMGKKYSEHVLISWRNSRDFSSLLLDRRTRNTRITLFPRPSRSNLDEHVCEGKMDKISSLGRPRFLTFRPSLSIIPPLKYTRPLSTISDKSETHIHFPFDIILEFPPLIIPNSSSYY